MKKAKYSFPVVCLLIFVVLTYFPVIYRYFPLLGRLKVVLLSGILMLISYIGTHNRYNNSGVFRNSIVFSWLSIMSLMSLGLVTSADRGLTMNMILLNLKFFIVFLVMIKIIDNRERLKVLVDVLVICGIGMALSTAFNFLDGSAFRPDGYRASAINAGMFADPNDLALFLNAMLPFALYLLLQAKKKTMHLIKVITIIAALIMTFSRGGFLGLCTTGVFFYIFFARKQRKYLLSMFTIALVLWLFAPGSYRERIASITDVKVDESTGMTGTRLDAWRIVTAQNENWMLGIGAGGSVYAAGKAMGDWHLIHNTFLQILVELGIVALMFYIGLFIIPFRQFKKLIRRRSEAAVKDQDTALFKTILISLASYGVTAFFLPQAYSAILYTLTALAVIELELIRKRQPRSDDTLVCA